MTQCPSTGQTVFTCQRMKPPEFEAISQEMGFRCPACGEIHKWTKAQAWLEAPAQAPSASDEAEMV
jgi:hypothetical protein